MKLYYYEYETKYETDSTSSRCVTHGFLVEHIMGFSDYSNGYHDRDYGSIKEFKNSWRPSGSSDIEIVEL